jgi:hypothetical protein
MWQKKFANRTIIKIFRIDPLDDYDLYSPNGIFFMFDDIQGLLIAANEQSSVTIEASTFSEVYSQFGIEYCEADLNELKPEDELNAFLSHSFTAIKTAEYTDRVISGTNFIIKQGQYAGVVLETNEGLKLTFYQIDSVPFVWFGDEIEFPNKGRWVIKENGE